MTEVDLKREFELRSYIEVLTMVLSRPQSEETIKALEWDLYRFVTELEFRMYGHLSQLKES